MPHTHRIPLSVSAVIAFLFCLPWQVYAQSCPADVANTIVGRAPICRSSIGFLEGNSVTPPTGATVSYQWEVNEDNCGSPNSNEWKVVSGATGVSYSVGEDNKQCYRRIVIIRSGNQVCRYRSNTINTNSLKEGVVVPTFTVTQPNCSTSTGAIVVNTPTWNGLTYSLTRSGGNTTTNTKGEFTNLTAGTYQLRVVAESGCTSAQQTITISTAPAGPTGNITPTNTTICSGSTQVLTVNTTATGVTFQWLKDGTPIGGATGSTFTAKEAGSYTVDISSSNGCKTRTAPAILNVTPAPSGNISPTTAEICSGGNTTLTITGATAGSSFQWYKNGVAQAGFTSSTYTATTEGTYTADVINGSCRAKATGEAVVRTTSVTPTAISPASTTLCSGSSVTLNISGGSTYQWRKDGVAINGANSATYTTNEAGNYTADIISGACSVKSSNTATVAVGSRPSGTITATPTAAVLCGGGNVTLTISGGTSYQWYKDGVAINGATGTTLDVNTAGKYKADIISGSCIGTSDEKEVKTGEPPTATITSNTTSICPGGSVTLTASGGSSYQWYRNGQSITGATGVTYAAVQPGSYVALVTQSNCSAFSDPIRLTQVDASTAGTLTPAAAQICSGSSIILTATGGNSYRWFKNNTVVSGATGSTLTVTTAGIYTVEITTASGCAVKLNSQTKVDVNPSPTGSISPATAAICAGSTTTLTATGGATYQWYKDGTPLSGATSPTLTVTDGGTYTADIIKDGCTAKASNNAVVSLKTVSGKITPDAASFCAGGSVVLTASGGTSYQWFKDGVAINGATAANYTARESGVFTADIIDGTCRTRADNEVGVRSVSITPSAISPATATICAGGSVNLTVTGGSSYQWYKNGVAITGATQGTYTANETGNYTADIISGDCKIKATNTSVVSSGSAPSGAISPASGAICPGSSLNLNASGGITYQWYKDGAAIAGATSARLTVTEPGSYTAEIISGDCKGKASNTVTITAGTPPSGNITASATSFCSGGSVILTTSGGDSYRWLLDGTAISGATNANYTATAAGVYSVEIKKNNCTALAGNTITLTQADAPTGSISPASATFCTGGSVTLTATGGSSYQWYKDGAKITNATAATYNATAAGTYTADVMNAGGCKGTTANSAVVTAGTAPTGTITPATASVCAGGSVALKVSGGTRYQWYKNGTAIIGATADELRVTEAGNYSADIINATCTGKASNTAVVTAAAALAGVVSPAAASICPGGSVVLTASGGDTYQWYKDGAALPGATSASYSASVAGTYYADISTNSGCKGKTNNSVISIGNAVTGVITPSNVSLCNNGSATLKISGGSSYQWYKDGVKIAGATGDELRVTDAGVYTADVISGNCTGKANTVTIAAAAPLAGSVSPATAIICTNGSQVLTATGGTTYQWFKNGVLITGITGNTYTAREAGVYSVKLSNGVCTADAGNTSSITVATPILFTATPVNTTCATTTGSINISNITGGTGSGYSYSKDGGATYSASPNFTALNAGTYEVVVKDGGGCTSAVQKVSITQAISTLAGTVTIDDASCIKGGSATIVASGGTQPYTYSFNGAAFGSAAKADNLQPGDYKAVIKDVGGCTVEVSFAVKAAANGQPNLVITNPTLSCTVTTLDLTATAITAGSDAGLTFTYFTNEAATIPLANPKAVGVGNFYIKATNAAGCFVVKKVTVGAGVFTTAPAINPAGPVNACINESVLLSADGSGTYQWYRNDTLIAGATTNTFRVIQTGAYKVVLQTGSCSAPSAPVVVNFAACGALPESGAFVPKAFTPNGNAANDLLRPVLYNMRSLNYFKVYNRWGQLVFQTSVVGQGWDGTIKGIAQNADTYTWVLECTGTDGKQYKQSGRSVLIR